MRGRARQHRTGMTEAKAPTHNQAQHRFEIVTEAGAAHLDYKLKPGEIDLVHTEVPERLEGADMAARSRERRSSLRARKI